MEQCRQLSAFRESCTCTILARIAHSRPVTRLCEISKQFNDAPERTPDTSADHGMARRWGTSSSTQPSGDDCSSLRNCCMRTGGAEQRYQKEIRSHGHSSTGLQFMDCDEREWRTTLKHKRNSVKLNSGRKTEMKITEFPRRAEAAQRRRANSLLCVVESAPRTADSARAERFISLRSHGSTGFSKSQR